MKGKKITEFNNTELLREEQKMKALILVFVGVLIVLFVVTILSSLKKGFGALNAVPVALLPLLFVLINNWNALKKEVKSRNL